MRKNEFCNCYFFFNKKKYIIYYVVYKNYYKVFARRVCMYISRQYTLCCTKILRCAMCSASSRGDEALKRTSYILLHTFLLKYTLSFANLLINLHYIYCISLMLKLPLVMYIFFHVTKSQFFRV